MELFVPAVAVGETVGRLVDAGFEVLVDDAPCRVVLASAIGERVDLGGINCRPDGHGVQAASGDIEDFPACG